MREIHEVAGHRASAKRTLKPPTNGQADTLDATAEKSQQGLGVFERYLSLWVALCIAAGVALGQLVPAVPNTLGEWEVAQVNLPIAVLIWAMIYPMMGEVDFQSVLGVRRHPKGITVTLVVNWLIRPFTMFGFAWLFLQGLMVHVARALATLSDEPLHVGLNRL